MSRWLPYLAELQPEMFCEVSPELAAEHGLVNDGWATIVSPRAAIEAKVLVTYRMTPLVIGGRTVHQIRLPYHWGVGTDAVVSGDAANDLLGVTLDPTCRSRSPRPGHATSGRGAGRGVTSCSAWSPSTRPAPASRSRPITCGSPIPPARSSIHRPSTTTPGGRAGRDGEHRSSARVPRSEEGGLMGQLAGPTDPRQTYGGRTQAAQGFFTDTSICIGCKACEVACKDWNHNPRDRDLELLGSSYDNTGALGASTWRHAAFIEQGRERIDQAREAGRALVSLGMPGLDAPAAADPAAVSTAPPDTAEFRWLMSSDVCKHCTHAGCLDVCPLARCSAPSSAPSWCKPMSATGAAPAWPAVRSASSSAAATARPPRRASAVSGEANNPRFPISVSPRSARCVTTGWLRADTGVRADLPDHVHQVRRPGRTGGPGQGTGRRAAC